MVLLHRTCTIMVLTMVISLFGIRFDSPIVV